MAAAVLPLAIEIARLFGGFFMAPAGENNFVVGCRSICDHTFFVAVF
jgi:hypothetical protein